MWAQRKADAVIGILSAVVASSVLIIGIPHRHKIETKSTLRIMVLIYYTKIELQLPSKRKIKIYKSARGTITTPGLPGGGKSESKELKAAFGEFSAGTGFQVFFKCTGFFFILKGDCRLNTPRSEF